MSRLILASHTCSPRAQNHLLSHVAQSSPLACRISSHAHTYTLKFKIAAPAHKQTHPSYCTHTNHAHTDAPVALSKSESALSFASATAAFSICDFQCRHCRVWLVCDFQLATRFVMRGFANEGKVEGKVEGGKVEGKVQRKQEAHEGKGDRPKRKQ